MAGRVVGLHRAFISHQHLSRGTNAVTANTAECSNLPSFIQNKNNAISCSCSWIGSVWLVFELTVPVLQVRPHTKGCTMQMPLSHVAALDCTEIPGMKESIFSHVQVREPLKVLGLCLVHRSHSIPKLSLPKVFSCIYFSSIIQYNLLFSLRPL